MKKSNVFILLSSALFSIFSCNDTKNPDNEETNPDTETNPVESGYAHRSFGNKRQ